MELSPASLSLFLALANDADNWSGTPLWDGNKREAGNLTDLKKKGLLKTDQDEDNKKCFWVFFTESGKELAGVHGIKL